MKYNPRLNAIVMPISELDNAYYLIMFALKQLRIAAGLPLTKYDREGMLTPHDHAAITILQLGANIGLDVDPHDHNKLDLTDA